MLDDVIISKEVKKQAIIYQFSFYYSHFSDDRLSLAEFTLICRALFRNDKGHIYVVQSDKLEQMFAVFDKNEDGYIDRDEFQFCWNQWIKTVLILYIFLHHIFTSLL